jgi:hypothetical protein
MDFLVRSCTLCCLSFTVSCPPLHSSCTRIDVFSLFGASTLALVRLQPAKSLDYYARAVQAPSQYRNLHHISWWAGAMVRLGLWRRVFDFLGSCWVLARRSGYMRVIFCGYIIPVYNTLHSHRRPIVVAQARRRSNSDISVLSSSYRITALLFCVVQLVVQGDVYIWRSSVSSCYTWLAASVWLCALRGWDSVS